MDVPLCLWFAVYKNVCYNQFIKNNKRKSANKNKYSKVINENVWLLTDIVKRQRGKKNFLLVLPLKKISPLGHFFK